MDKHERDSLDFEALQRARGDKQGPRTRDWLARVSKVFRQPYPSWEEINQELKAGISGARRLIRCLDYLMKLIEKDQSTYRVVLEATQFVETDGQSMELPGHSPTEDCFDKIDTEIRQDLESMRDNVITAAEVAKLTAEIWHRKRGSKPSDLRALILGAEINYDMTGGKDSPTKRWDRNEGEYRLQGGSVDYIYELLKQLGRLGKRRSKQSLAKVIRDIIRLAYQNKK